MDTDTECSLPQCRNQCPGPPVNGPQTNGGPEVLAPKGFTTGMTGMRCPVRQRSSTATAGVARAVRNGQLREPTAGTRWRHGQRTDEGQLQVHLNPYIPDLGDPR